MNVSLLAIGFILTGSQRAHRGPTLGLVALAGLALVIPAQAFEVVSNRPFAARCNGPLGAVKVLEPDVTRTLQTTELKAVRQSAVQQAVTAQHNIGTLARAARPVRLLAQRGIIRGFPRVSFPRTVVHVTPAGQIVLPDLVAAMQSGEQIGNLSNELKFTYSGYDEGTKAALADYLKTAVAVAKRVYGPPAFNITVKIINDAQVQDLQGGYYDVTANEIHLAPLTGNFAEDTFVLLKLVLHAFHDDAIFFFDAWEEGFAGAAALAVQTTAGVSPGYNPYDPGPFYALSVYEAQNQPALGNSTFYPESGFGGMLVWRLAMTRAAWFKCYIEDPQFFNRFNIEYYRQYTPALAGDTPGLKDIGASVLPQVEGQSFYEWYEQQYVLDTSIHTGPKLFTWNIPLPESVVLIVEHYSTDGLGNEDPRGGQALTIYWNYDFTVSLYAEEGNVVSVPASGEGAGEGFLIPTFFNIGGPQRITVQVDLNGLRAYYPYPYGMRGFEQGENNFYGAIVGAISGKIDIGGTDTVADLAVSRGVWGKELRGGTLTPSQLTVTFKTADGEQVTRTVNAGWDSYVVLMRGGSQQTVSTRFVRGMYMMSLPLYPLSPSAPEVLGVAPDRLLLARWDPRLEGTGRYRLWPDIDPFAPGKAFWIKLFSDLDLTVKGLSVDPDVDFPVPLQFGWNMVGVPRGRAVNVANLRVQVGTDASVSFEEAVTRRFVQSSVFGYTTARGYEQVQQLEPFRGYWVRCMVPSEARLLFPPEGAATAQRRGAADSAQEQTISRSGWAARVYARSGEGAGNVVIGQAVDGKALDRELAAPPVGPGGVRVAIVQAGGRETPDGLYRSLLPGRRPTWRIAVEGAPGAAVTLGVEPADASQATAPRLFLTPLTGGKAWLAATQREQSFTLNAEGKLLLQVQGEDSGVGGEGAPLLSCVTASAGDRGATVVFTLAEAASVDAEVLNIAGRTVRRLALNGVQSAGRNSVRWNGLNDDGALAPPGMYLVSLEAKSPSGVRQRAVVSLTIRRR